MIARKTQYLSYVYHGTGLTGVVNQILKKLISPVYQREMQYVWLRVPRSASHVFTRSSAVEANGTECIIVESLESFECLRSQIPSWLAAKLETRLTEGCVLFLARRPTEDGSRKQIVGYSITQQGVFSALERVGKVSSNILFSHYTEVLPKFRGQRVIEVIADAKDLYCQRNGYREHCGVVSTDNLPSMRSLIRLGSRLVGTVQRVSILGIQYKWEPRWEQVLEMISEEVPLSKQQLPDPRT